MVEKIGAIGTEKTRGTQDVRRNYYESAAKLAESFKRNLKRTPLLGGGDTVAASYFGSNPSYDNASGIK